MKQFKLKKIGCLSVFVLLLCFLSIFSFLLFKKELPKLVAGNSNTNISESSVAVTTESEKDVWTKFKSYLPDLETHDITTFEIVENTFLGIDQLREITDPNSTAYDDLNDVQKKELDRLISDQNWDWESSLKKEITAAKNWIKLRTYLPDLKKYKINGLWLNGTLFSLIDFKSTINSDKVDYGQLFFGIKRKLKMLFSLEEREQTDWESVLQNEIFAKIWIKFRTYLSDLKTYQIDSLTIDGNSFSFIVAKTVADPDYISFKSLKDGAKRELQALVNQVWEPALEDAIAAQVWTQLRTYLSDLTIYNVDEIIVDNASFSLAVLKAVANPISTDYDGLEPLVQAKVKELVGKTWEFPLQTAITLKLPADKIWSKFRTYLSDLTTYNIESITIDDSSFSLTALKQINNPTSTDYDSLGSSVRKKLTTLEGKIWEPVLQDAIAAQIWIQLQLYLPALTTYALDSFSIEGNVFSLFAAKAVPDPNNIPYQNLGVGSQRELQALVNQAWEPALQNAIAAQIWTQLKLYLPDLGTYLIDEIVVDDSSFSLALFKAVPDSSTTTYDHLNPLVQAKLKELINKSWKSPLEKVIATQIWTQLKPYLPDLTTYGLASFSIEGNVFSLLATKAVADPDATPYQNLGAGPQRELQALVNKNWEPALQDAIAIKIWTQLRTYFPDLKAYDIDKIVIDRNDFLFDNFKELPNPNEINYDGLGDSYHTKLKKLIGKPWEFLLQNAIAAQIWTQLKPYLSDLKIYALASFSIEGNAFSLLAAKAVADPDDVLYQNLEDGPQKELQALVNQAWEPALQDAIAAQIWTHFKLYLPDLTTYAVDEILLIEDGSSFSLLAFKAVIDPNTTAYDRLNPSVQAKLKELINKAWGFALDNAIAAKIWTQLKTYLSDLTTYNIDSIIIDDTSFSFAIFKTVADPGTTPYDRLGPPIKEKLKWLIGQVWESFLENAIAAKIWTQLKTYLSDLTTYAVDSIVVDDVLFSFTAFKPISAFASLDYHDLKSPVQTKLITLVSKSWEPILKEAITSKIWIKLKSYLPDLPISPFGGIDIRLSSGTLFSFLAFKQLAGDDLAYPDLSPPFQTKLTTLIGENWEPSVQDLIAGQIWTQFKTYLSDLKIYSVDNIMIDDSIFSLTDLKAVLNPDATHYYQLNLLIQAELKKWINKTWQLALEDAIAAQIWVILKPYFSDLETYNLASFAIDDVSFSLVSIATVSDVDETSYDGLNSQAQTELRALVKQNWKPALEEAITTKIWTKLQSYLFALEIYNIDSFLIAGSAFSLVPFKTIVNPSSTPYQNLGTSLQPKLKLLIGQAWEAVLEDVVAAQIWIQFQSYLPDLETYNIDEIRIDDSLFSLTLFKEVANPTSTTYPNLNALVQVKLKELINKVWEAPLLTAITVELPPEKIWTKLKSYLPDLIAYKIKDFWIDDTPFSLINLTEVSNFNETDFDALEENPQAELRTLVGQNWELALQDAIAAKIWTQLKPYLADLEFYNITSLTINNKLFTFAVFKAISDPNETAYDRLELLVKSKLKKLITKNWEPLLKDAIAAQIWMKLKFYLPDLITYQIDSLTIDSNSFSFITFKAIANPDKTNYGDLTSSVQAKLKQLIHFFIWEEGLQDLIKEPKAKAVWPTIKTDYLPDLQTFEIRKVKTVSLIRLQNLQEKDVPYNNLPSDLQTELKQLVVIVDWEKVLQAAIMMAKIKEIINVLDYSFIQEFDIKRLKGIAIPNIANANWKSRQDFLDSLSNSEIKKELTNLVPLAFSKGKKAIITVLNDVVWEAAKRKIWTKIKTNYLAVFQKFKIEKFTSQIGITNLVKIKDKTTSYDDLSEKAKIELAQIATSFLSEWESFLISNIQTIFWEKIKAVYFADLQRFNIRTIGDVDISHIVALQKEISGLGSNDPLLKNINTELKNLIAYPDWEEVLADLIVTAKAKLIWPIFQTDYLADLQALDINQIAEIAIPTLEKEGKQTTTYPALSNQIKVELKQLATLPNWEELLKSLIDKITRMETVWKVIKTNYLPAIQKFKIKRVEDTGLFQLAKLKEQTSTYFSLPATVKRELTDLITLPNWKESLQTVIETNQMTTAWAFLQTRIIALRNYQITVIGDKKIDLILKEAFKKNSDYHNLTPQAREQLKALSSFDNYQAKIEAAIETNTPKPEKKFPLALVLGVTLPVTFLILLGVGYLLFKRKKAKK